MEQTRAKRSESAVFCDADLVARVAAGETDVFVALMQRYNRMLYRAARSVTGDDGEAEDVVQEAWTRAYAHIGEFRGEARIATWLVRIVLNEALGRKRRARPTMEMGAIDEVQGARVIMFPAAPNDPESDLSRRQVRRILEGAIDSLPPSFRAVFVLRAIEDMSVEDIAKQLEIAEATVRTRMHRSRALLRKTIEKNLSASLSDVFPFDGARCGRLTDRVLEMIKTLDRSR